MPKNIFEQMKVLNFEGKITIEKSGDIKKEILDALKKSNKIVINLTRIENADVSFFQLLYASKKEAELQQKELSFTGKISDSLREMLLIGGFCTFVPEQGKDLAANLHGFNKS